MACSQSTLMRLLVVAMVIVSLLAGCSDAPPASGQDLRTTAENAAADMDASAVLVAMFAPEWASESFGERFEEESPEAAALNQGVDDNLGDGEANVWGFMFETDGDPLLIALSSGGTLLHADYIPKDSETADAYDHYAPLGQVAIDSREAARIVRDNSEDFVARIAEPDAVVVMALGEDAQQGTPFWIFMAFSESDDEDFVFALVNAEDGTYSDFGSMFGG